MAALASQVILHPTVSQSLNFASTTLGRDKTYRAFQYWSRFYAWYLLSLGDKEAAVKWDALKTHLATARKLLRLGKPVEHLQAALKACLSTGPIGEQITTAARQIAYFGYLFFDAFVWGNSVKFLKLSPDSAAKVSKLSNRFWLAGILLSIVNGALKSVRLAKDARRLHSSKTWGDKNLADEAERETRISAVVAARGATRRQLVIDLLDVWIPATNLGFSSMNDGVLGIFGTITSLIAAQQHWQSLNGKK